MSLIFKIIKGEVNLHSGYLLMTVGFLKSSVIIHGLLEGCEHHFEFLSVTLVLGSTIIHLFLVQLSVLLLL